MRAFTVRRFFYEIHLWLGILSGIILFVVCLSGTIYTFRTEVQHFAEPEKYFVEVPAGERPLSVEEWISVVEKEKPGMQINTITIPEKANRTVTMALSKKEEKKDTGNKPQETGNKNRGEGNKSQDTGSKPRGEVKHASGGQGSGRKNQYMVYVNPYTGEITGEGANIVDPFFGSVMRLHRFLWLPTEIGRPVVGAATLIFIVLCLTGFLLWLPRTWKGFSQWKSWKPGFRVRLRRGAWPFIYDSHNSLGFYLLLPLLLMALTGLCWSFSWYRDAASNFLGDQIFKQRNMKPEKVLPLTEVSVGVPISEILRRQEELTPGPGEIIISLPQNAESALVIQKGRTGFFALAVKDKTQWDRFRGTVIPVDHLGQQVEVERFSDKPLGGKIAASIRALHLGDVTGLSSKIFFFFSCLVATTFPITGAALWVRKIFARRRARRNAESESSSEEGASENEEVTSVQKSQEIS
ncbi:MAG: PepSY-associated TM helix domain-containing protein [Planctomycetia bacterium]|nr:PepSY-associated TM helix domain-containing protein [Planctomycetia bacterium]